MRKLTHSPARRTHVSRPGVTLIELVVALVVIGTAAVGTTIAVFNAYGQLQRQRHRMTANEFLRAEVEYWQGRIHIAMPTPAEMSSRGPERVVTIDERSPGNAHDDIIGVVRREPIEAHVLINTTNTLQYYWEIPVVINYTEPTWVFDGEEVDLEYRLVGYWLEAEPTNFKPD
ncbi:MAG: hypothetical protein MAG453_00687 [Calditrichaeota bacterium]|nr:hypothetical protein [Calditrichota bacterium]